MSDAPRARRSREWPELPRARNGAILALGWSVVALAEVLTFAIAIAPSLGQSFSIHFSGRGSTGVDLPVGTGFMVGFALTLAIAAILISLLGTLPTGRMLRTAVVSSALISVLAPLTATSLLRDSYRAAFDPTTGVDILLGLAPTLAVLLGLATFLLVVKPFAGRGKRARVHPR